VTLLKVSQCLLAILQTDLAGVWKFIVDNGPPMETEENALDKSPLPADELAALEERDRQGYTKQPQQLDEILEWEREAAWPAEWRTKANAPSAPPPPQRAKS
jgi:hypothetical protein